MGDAAWNGPRWGARADLEGNSPATLRIPANWLSALTSMRRQRRPVGDSSGEGGGRRSGKPAGRGQGRQGRWLARMGGAENPAARGDPRPMPTDHGPELEALRKRLADAKEFLLPGGHGAGAGPPRGQGAPPHPGDGPGPARPGMGLLAARGG